VCYSSYSKTDSVFLKMIKTVKN